MLREDMMRINPGALLLHDRMILISERIMVIKTVIFALS